MSTADLTELRRLVERLAVASTNAERAHWWDVHADKVAAYLPILLDELEQLRGLATDDQRRGDGWLDPFQVARMRNEWLVVPGEPGEDTTGLTETELRLRRRLTEAEAVIQRASDRADPESDLYWILDDYDGSMDSIKTLVRERDEARAALAWALAVDASDTYDLTEEEIALAAAVDALDRGVPDQ